MIALDIRAYPLTVILSNSGNLIYLTPAQRWKEAGKYIHKQLRMRHVYEKGIRLIGLKGEKTKLLEISLIFNLSPWMPFRAYLASIQVVHKQA